ncbi:membrane protein of ER body-like protein isoform X2 [Salvia miltiorrhiza]|uniref:membrane protein of ER body-like protein isoform X2 n=1 Tax=Salvia miltiorrhiza TaxID=226208 RepID=UPI0025AC0242|nr:membrane protein of ER body-like protein isoform X2 [Salvia miltiorrhiza]
MEKEEERLEPAEVEEEAAAETTPLVRKSTRKRNESKMFAKYGVEVDGGVSNGVSVKNNYAILSQNEGQHQKMEEAENESEAINGEHKIQENESVVENEAEATNGENNSENLVFHDKVEGIWKCRICTWTYGNGSVCVDRIQNHRGVLHNLINVKTLNFISQGLGVNPISTYMCKTLIVEGPARTNHDILSLDPTIQSNGTSVVNNQLKEKVEENDVPSSNLPLCDSSSQEGLGVNPISTYVRKTLILERPAHTKHDVSSLEGNGFPSSNLRPSDSSSEEGVNSTSTYIIREPFLKGPAIEFNGASVINNPHEEEVEGNGFPSSNLRPSDSSSEEDLVAGVNSTSTYIIREPFLKGPAIEFNGASVINNPHEEEVEGNGFPSSNLRPSDSSSEEDLVAGVNSTSTYIIREPFLKGPAIEFNGASVISNQYEEEVESNGISSSFQEGRTSYEPSEEIKPAETELINEDDLEITESDVERVIQKQTTHDLYCPNCKSCITKRVILSKRKRRIRITDEEVKRPKTGTAAVGAVSSEDQVYQEGGVDNDDAQTPTIDEDERERGPAIFRCLSCFSIFIPTGDGFKLFPSFGGKRVKDNAQDEQAPGIKKNWFDIFIPYRQKAPVEKGSSSETNVQQVSSAIPSSDPAHESGLPLVLQDTGSPTRAPEQLEGTTGKTNTHEGRDLTLPDLYNVLKLPLLVDAMKSDVLAADQQMESKPGREVHTSLDKDIVQLSTPLVSTAEDVDGTLNISVSIPHDEQDVTATIVTTSIIDSRNVDSRSSDSGEVYPDEVPQQMTTTTTFEFHHDKPLRTGITSDIGDAPAAQGAGNETRITIDTHPPVLPCIDEGITPPIVVSQSGTQTTTADSEGRRAREERKVEVIKSIVYGGLAETMTSLSVVSSAAGGGATTLNVLTLGAANLIGGLFIIAHNLWDLRCDRVEEQLSNQITEQADRYRQLLGRRQNFALHAVLVIISYIMFGLVPPVLYGFSFRGSDDKQLKLLMVAAASLVCIVMLTVGKVYVQRPPKSYFKTVMTFLILGISVSGVSYAAGGLVERLLVKLGLFGPSSAAPNLFVPEMTPVGSGWASY